MSTSLTYLFFGYAAVWVILFGYLVSLSRREARLRADLESVRRQMEARGGAEAAPTAEG